MFAFSRRFIYALSNKIRKNAEDNEKGLSVDFAKTKKSPFDIKSESSYSSYLSNGSLVLGLKKTNFIAWADIPGQEYQDHIIRAKIRLDSLGGYASTGVIFRIVEQDSYYLALVSSRGYFRLDVIKDNAPKALIAWTEVSDFDESNIDIEIVTYGACLIFIANGKWVGEVNDDSVSKGRVGFALASYESEIKETIYSTLNVKAPMSKEYVCKAQLDNFTVDTRIDTIEDSYKKWNNDSNINAEGRLRLAETFAVMGKSSKALEQINRAWKKRDEIISSASVSYTEVRTKKELLLAARMSFDLGQYNEADEFINMILEQWPSSPEGKLAHTEKIKILYELNKFPELKDFALQHSSVMNKDIAYYTMLARSYWELKEYKDSAAAWDKAFEIEKENGIYAANAANALELAEMENEALAYFLEAGKLFLNQDNKGELAAMMPKLSLLGENNWEARALAGKWAFSIENYARSEREFAAAERLRTAERPRPKADPALYYLWGLVLNLKGKNNDAIRLLEKAVKYAPDYGLFRFKLAELRIKNGCKNTHLFNELKSALEYIDDEAKREMAHYAGELLLNAGDSKNAKYFFELAKKNPARNARG